MFIVHVGKVAGKMRISEEMLGEVLR